MKNDNERNATAMPARMGFSMMSTLSGGYRNRNLPVFDSADEGKAAADKAAADQAAADKAAADKAAADKAAADKAAADALVAAGAEEVAKRLKAVEDEKAELLKESMKRKDKLKAQEDELKALKDKVSKFDGLDLEEIQKLMDGKRTAEEEALAKKGEFETLKARMKDEHEKKMKEKDDALADLQKKLSSTSNVINDLTIGRSFSDSKFIAEELTLTPSKARVIYGSHFDIDDSGKIVAYDKPRGEANRTPLIDAGGDPIPFTDALKKLVELDPDKDTILKSKIAPGSDSNPGKNTKNPAEKKVELHGQDKIAAALAAKKK
jgi:hypothetical protein